MTYARFRRVIEEIQQRRKSNVTPLAVSSHGLDMDATRIY